MCACVFLPGVDRTSERDAGREQPSAGCASGEHPAEFDCVELELVTFFSAGEGATCGSRQHERERLPMPACPVGNDVGDDSTVMVSVDLDLAPSGAADVHAM